MKHNSKFKNTFSKFKFYLLEKKEVNKGIEKKNKLIFLIRRVFSELKKHETGDAKGDQKRKEKTQNNLNQMENGTRKTCSKNKKQEEREKHKEYKVNKEKRRRTNEEKCKEEDQKPEQMTKEVFSSQKKKGGRKKEE